MRRPTAEDEESAESHQQWLRLDGERDQTGSRQAGAHGICSRGGRGADAGGGHLQADGLDVQLHEALEEALVEVLDDARILGLCKGRGSERDIAAEQLEQQLAARRRDLPLIDMV